MKILIVGGGVAGTALAGMLKDTANVTLVEKAPKWGDIGYALCLWGNGQKILRELGADKLVVERGYNLPWDEFDNSQGEMLKKISWKIFKPYGGSLITTRTNLHQSLIQTLDKRVAVRLGTTIKAIRQRGDVATVTFSDGKKEAFDLVVGADGIHSKVRELTYGKGYLKDYGWTIYAFWSPIGEKVPKGSIELARGGKVFMMYPMKDKAVVMLAVSSQFDTEDVPEKRREKLHELFEGFDTSVTHIIDAIEDPTRIFYDQLRHVDLPDWYHGRVTLMGDAQHATSPIIGMGASMALEDAYVLGSELKKITEPHDITTALQNYAARRGPRIKKYRQTSIFFERWLMTKSPFITAFRDVALPVMTDKVFTRPMEKLLTEEI